MSFAPDRKRIFSPDPDSNTRPFGLRNQSAVVETLWNKAENVLRRMFNGQADMVSKVELMEICSQVYEFDISPPDPKESRLGLSVAARDTCNVLLYRRLGRFMKTFVDAIVKNEVSNPIPPEQQLEFYYRQCKIFNSASRAANLIFQHLNRWAKAQRKLSDGIKKYVEILDLSQMLWRDAVFRQYGIQVGNSLLMEITNDRNGEGDPVKNQDLFKEVIQSFIKMGINKSKYQEDRVPEEGFTTQFVSQMMEEQILEDKRRAQEQETKALEIYRLIFERRFLFQTGHYYRRKVQRLMELVLSDEINGLKKFLVEIDKWFQLEETRGTEYLHRTTAVALNDICIEVIIFDNLDYIMEPCESILSSADRDYISVYNRVVTRAGTEHEDTFAKYLEASIIARVQVSIQKIETLLDEEKNLKSKRHAVLFSSKIIDEYVNHKELVNTSLNGTSKNVKALHKAFKTILKPYNSVTPLQLLAVYCDILLKSNLTLRKLKERLENLFDIVLLTRDDDGNDMDIFQMYYLRPLVDRLIYKTSSDDLEKLALTKLGENNNEKLKDIFENMNASIELNQEFQTYLSLSSIKKHYELTVTTIAQISWPFPLDEIRAWNVPNEIATEINRFQNFYSEHKKNRRLTWVWNKSKGVIVYNYTPTNKTKMVISFEQASVLFQFQNQDSRTVKDLCSLTKIDGVIMAEILHQLVEPRILIAMPDNALSDSKTSLILNKDWTCKDSKDKLFKLWKPLNIYKLQAMHKESQKAIALLKSKRKYAIQRAIIRAIKPKTDFFGRNELVCEVTAALVTGQITDVDVKEIKRQINWNITDLIQNNYIELEKNTEDRYKYKV